MPRSTLEFQKPARKRWRVAEEREAEFTRVMVKSVREEALL